MTYGESMRVIHVGFWRNGSLHLGSLIPCLWPLGVCVCPVIRMIGYFNSTRTPVGNVDVNAPPHVEYWPGLLTNQLNWRICRSNDPFWLQLFDMKKFQANVSRELRRAYPDRRRLECQCLSALAFVKAEQDILECPIWVLIINVVAMDMLKSKLPPGKGRRALRLD